MTTAELAVASVSAAVEAPQPLHGASRTIYILRRMVSVARPPSVTSCLSLQVRCMANNCCTFVREGTHCGGRGRPSAASVRAPALARSRPQLRAHCLHASTPDNMLRHGGTKHNMLQRRNMHQQCHVCTGTGHTPAQFAPGLGSAVPHLHRDWAQQCHTCTGTGPTPATCAPHLDQDCNA